MELNTKSEKQLQREKVAKPLLWLGIVSIIMLFAGLTSAYVVRQAKGNWLKFDLPFLFWVSTAIILISSVTMNWALASAKKDDTKNIKRALLFTLLLGLAFVASQFMAWSALVQQNVFFAGKLSNSSGSFLYVLTGAHLAHLGGGIISLLYVFVKSLKGRYHSKNLLGLELCSIYWHFLDLLWIYLFLFLLFIR